ncbi:hypothetical protein ACN9JG_06090 [Cereibacter azotoformans]|uniref:hypothetical protein n=1 Tax=Cereibacter azotoformans TaxID=43057 RepID=UPI003B21CB4C
MAGTAEDLLREARDILREEADAFRDGISINGVVDTTETDTMAIIERMEGWIARADALLGDCAHG